VVLGGKSHKKRTLPSLPVGQPRQKAAPLSELNKTARTIYHWMFSWAQPSYSETEEEYFLSKAFFMKFVASREVREVLGLGVVGRQSPDLLGKVSYLTKKEWHTLSDIIWKLT
jgi:hypothetical protein